MSALKPLIFWFRRDLRLHDHPGLAAAVATGRPIVPLFILDESFETLGAAPKWRLGAGLAAFAARLTAVGAPLILRRGPARAVLEALIAETGAEAVFWSRLYDAPARARDTEIKSALKSAGIAAQSFPGFLLHEPLVIETKTGGPYKVYTPYWRAVRDRDPGAEAPEIHELRPASLDIQSDNLEDWRLGAAMNRGAAVLAKHARPGEAAALARLAEFVAGPVAAYAERRDFPAEPATSRLSEHLTLGEISPRRIWHAGRARMIAGAPGAETFLKELVWREFAWHLFFHFPAMDRESWRPEWASFEWQGESPVAEAWRRGQTGEPFVDAALRELFATGFIHNRARMVAASYLTKHLRTDWRIGLAWFAECLIDWDPASNAMGWQWVAGSGPDAAPYFRIFNPEGQAEKFDPKGTYRRKFMYEATPVPPLAQDFLDAAPRAWGLAPGGPRPRPLVGLAAGREAALVAYQAWREGS